MRQIVGDQRRFLTLLFLGAAVLSLSGCGQVEIESRWRTGEIVIDGSAEDWKGLLWSIEDSGIFFGVLNDDRNVYVCVEAADPGAADQALRRGLTVWFDPKGGKGHALGLRYPVGTAWDEFEGPRGRREEGGPGRDEPWSDELPRRRPGIRGDEIEIIGPGRDEKAKLRLNELKGIEVSLSMDSGVLVYELKVPLSKTGESPYAAGSEPGKYLGIGFESPKSDISSSLMGGGRIPGAGSPGVSGRLPGRGGRMGGRGGRNIELPERFKLWLKARLAAPASETPLPPALSQARP